MGVHPGEGVLDRQPIRRVAQLEDRSPGRGGHPRRQRLEIETREADVESGDESRVGEVAVGHAVVDQLRHAKVQVVEGTDAVLRVQVVVDGTQQVDKVLDAGDVRGQRVRRVPRPLPDHQVRTPSTIPDSQPILGR